MADEKRTVEEFWNAIRDKRGGEATVRAFGRYLGRSGDGRISDRSGLIYLAAGTLWFESVETQAKLFGFPMPGAGNSKYEPMELGIGLGEIEGAAVVGLRDALACVKGAFESSNLKPIGFLGGFFDTGVLQMKLRDGSAIFVEASKDKELAEILGGKG